MHEPLLLIVCDGWGIAPDGPGNAISLAKTPNFDRLKQKAIYTTLRTSSDAVGLPEGQMGNSEVGHLNLGAGRVVYQDIMLINKAISDGTFFVNPVLVDAYNKAKQSTLHLMGLLSDGGVHSDINHLKALITGAKQAGVKNVVIDAFLDGRDTEPRSALRYIQEIKNFTHNYKDASFATIGGRFYGMDRDKRWERVQKSYFSIIQPGTLSPSPEQAVIDAYTHGENDEFITPCRIVGNEQPVSSKDVFIFFNYRSDRTREITHALTDKEFTGFNRGQNYPLPYLYCMTPYDECFTLPILFPRESLRNTIGEVISKAGYRQLRIAETEKYAHVTFFFNGGREEPFLNEDRILVPSPRVPTYDLQPEMSAPLVTEKLVEAASQNYDFILLNLANLDMVGHTGIIPATIRAIETVDASLGELYDTYSKKGYNILITADHGNAEQMLDEEGNIQTSHSMNQVPFLFLPPHPTDIKLLSNCYLRDVADLILYLEGIPKPKEMNESRLIA
jgi:2,3-bisphosphoglycerate-independent phosphoglycerate mutase